MSELSMGAPASQDRSPMRWFRALSWPVVYTIVMALAFTAFLVGPLAQAGFGTVDDHEIIRMLGPDKKLELHEMPGELLATEVGSPGQGIRYRPIYYSMKVIESAVFRDNPHAHYLFRTAIYLLMAASLFWVAVRSVGPVMGVVLVGVTLGLSFWFDLWPRLGPNEQYASAGLALFLIGAAEIVRKAWRRSAEPWDANLALMCAGAFFAAGSKENFVFLAAPLLVATFFGWRNKTLRIRSMALSVATMFYCALIFIIALVGVLHVGGDTHGATVDTRMQAFGAFAAQFMDPTLTPYPYGRFMAPSLLWLKFALAAVALTIVISALFWFFGPKQNRPDFLRRLRFVGLIGAIAVVWFAWEIFFYYGNWPTGMRYDFPGMLFPAVVMGSALLLCKAWLPEMRAWRLGLNAVLIVAVLLAWRGGGLPLFDEIRIWVAENNARTREFGRSLSESAAAVAVNPDWPIFVEVNKPTDYEGALTLPLWLRWKDVQNPLFLRAYPPEEAEHFGGFQHSLLDRLNEVGQEGGSDYLPIAEADPDAEARRECYSLSYTGPTSDACTPLTVNRFGAP